jgi:hypothetical protein
MLTWGYDVYKEAGGIIYQVQYQLKRVSSKMDLGVLYDLKQTLINNIDQKIAKAYGMLGFIIRRSKQFKYPYLRDEITLLQFCSFDIGICVWSLRHILWYSYEKDRID